MDYPEKTCCFTGHRQLPNEAIPALRVRLRRELERQIGQGFRFFAAGGARGFDTLAAQAVLELRETHPHIRLILVLPCPDQTRGWNQADKEAYEAVRRAADKAVYVSDRYTSGCMLARNRRLVEGSGLCLCYLTQPRGGTRYTVEYCRRRGVPVINLADE